MPHLARTGAISRSSASYAWSAVGTDRPVGFGLSGQPCVSDRAALRRRSGRPDHRVVEAAKARISPPSARSSRQHADVNGPQGDGATALHWAAHWDDPAMADAAHCRRRTGQRRRRSRGDAARARLPQRQRDDGGTPARGGRERRTSSSVVGETPLMIAAHTGNAARRGAAAGARRRRHGAGEASLGPDRADARGRRESRRRRADAPCSRRRSDKPARRTVSPRCCSPRSRATSRSPGCCLPPAPTSTSRRPTGSPAIPTPARSFKPDTEAAALLVAIDSQHEAMARFLLDSGAIRT